METLRTPDERFAALPDYPYEPAYAQVPDDDGGSLRIAYVDAGPADGPVAVLLHGEPSWGYLYRHVMRPLFDAGIRCVVPDLVGFGRSDKPRYADDHTYARHVGWIRALVVDELDLGDMTVVGQDWGGLVGLRLATEHEDRVAQVVAANTGLPTGDHDMPEVWHRFRQAVEHAETLDVGRLVQAGCRTPLSDAVRTAYDAPFPDEHHKAGPRAMPGLVPITPDDPASAANRIAWDRLGRWRKPFLVSFSDGDPITGGMAPVLERHVPTARRVTVEGAGHFLQEDAGSQLGKVIRDFMTEE